MLSEATEGHGVTCSVTVLLIPLIQGSLTEPGAKLASNKPQPSSCLYLPPLWGDRYDVGHTWPFTWLLRI